MSDGIGCVCAAHSENECCCGADWRPKELIDLRQQLTSRDAEVAKLRQAALDYDKRWHEEQVKCDQLRKDVKLLHGLLLRYRTETPPVHSPHMICRLVDEALATTEPKL